jgi:hypothetical protein
MPRAQRLALAVLLCVATAGPFVSVAAGGRRGAKAPTTAPADASAATRYILHLPGIGGHRGIDDSLVSGLRQGGVDGLIEIYDWTCNDPGISALVARQRNHEQARLIALALTNRFNTNPQVPIYLTAHSGGAGVVVWALEQLPPDVMVESVLLLAPALSPKYDLTAALRHVRGAVYVVSSKYDPILGPGTRAFGTIDGVKTDAAGRVGFSRPSGGDALEYAKLVPMPHQGAWVRFRNIGDHVGPMTRPFARQVLAPLIIGSADGLKDVSATQPAATQASRGRPQELVASGH